MFYLATLLRGSHPKHGHQHGSCHFLKLYPLGSGSLISQFPNIPKETASCFIFLQAQALLRVMCWGREPSPPVSCLILSFLQSTCDLLSQLCHGIGDGGYSTSAQKLEQPNTMIRFHLHCTWDQFILTNLPAAVIETETSPPSPNTRDILTSIFCMSPSVPSHKKTFLGPASSILLLQPASPVNLVCHHLGPGLQQ